MLHELEPRSWKVIAQTHSASTSILLGDHVFDSHRVALSIRKDEDEGIAVDATVIYPCRECGWQETCEGGEECHS